MNRSEDRDGDRCYNCHERGHFRRECPRLQSQRGSNFRDGHQREMATSPGRPTYIRPNSPGRPMYSRSSSPGRGTQTDLPYNDKRVYQGSTLNTPGWTMVAPIYINGHFMEAIIDTASQVTLIGQKVAERLKLVPEVDSSIRIRGIGEDMEMQAKIVRKAKLTVGCETFTWDLIVGPSREICILGIDFLNQVQAEINFQHSHLRIGNSIIPAEIRANRKPSEASSVSVVESCNLEPFSGRVVQCRLSQIIRSDFIIEPSVPEPLTKDLVIPEALMSEGSTAELHIFNATESIITLPKDTPIASATAVSEVLNLEGEEEKKIVIENMTGGTFPNASRDVGRGPELGPELFGSFNLGKFEDTRDRSPEVEEVPGHLKAMFEECKSRLQEEECRQLKKLLIEFQDVFAQNDYDLGEFTEIMHTIDTGDAPPVKCGLRRTPLGFQDKEEEHLKKMLDAGVIQPSVSEWAAAPVIVKKKCGSYRYCLDYRGLNGVTRKDNFPLPLIEECLDTLAENFYFSTLDMASGYWQLLIDPADRHKTAFLTRYGLFEHVRLAMGLCNSPATYQRAMTLVLRDLLWKNVLAYLDDIIILGSDFTSHLANLREVFVRFRYYNLKFKPKKCVLFGTEVDFLGRRVSRSGVSIPESKVKTVEEWPRPTQKTQLEAFLGFINYHRDFIPHLAEEAAVLYELVKSSRPGDPLAWDECHERAFLRLKQSMVTAPVLGYPRAESLFILDTDASDHAIGAELSQIQDGREIVIAYGSMSLNAQQRRYCTTRKELLALVTFLNHFRFYLLGRSFLVRTDHNSLTWLMRFRHIEGQLARWIEAVAQFDFKIAHRAGKNHGNADGLSRIPQECDCLEAGQSVQALPCGGCKYCANKHQQWQRFEDYIDEVVPLAIRNTTVMPDEEPGIIIEADIDWIAEQAKDPEVEIVKRWIRDEEDPSSEILYLQSATTKRLWANREQLELIEDVLHYKWVGKIERPPRQLIIVPLQQRAYILQLAHDAKSAGHPGQLRTKLNVLQRFFWPGLTSDVRQFVESCHICSTLKKGNRTRRAGMKMHHAGFPMERVHVDILGPFVESNAGNRYVFVMIDQFTKWLELAPLADQTAQVVAGTLVQQFICRMGCAYEIFTDQGRNFESALFKEVCKLLEMAKLRTTPYRPSSNGQVERMNREILFKIRAYLDKKQKDWDLHLPFIGMSLRASINESTGYSPNMMMLGREVTVPLDFVAGRPPAADAPQSTSEYVQKLQETLHDTHALARDQLGLTLVRRKKYYDRKKHSVSFEVGDLVYALNSASPKGHSRKLQPIFTGPFLVTHKISDILYQIQGRRGKGKQVLHHDRLKMCQDRVIPLWLRRERTEFLNNTMPEAELEETPSLERLWTEQEDEAMADEDTPAVEPHDEVTSVDETVAPDEERTSVDHQESPGDRGQFRLPGARRQEQSPAGPRRLSRVSRPPAWLRDYTY